MDKWDVVAGVYNTTFTLFFFLLAFLMLIIAYKGYKADNNYGGTSTIVCAAFFIFFGFYNNIFWFLPYPFVGYIIWWIGIILAIMLTFALGIRRIGKKIDAEKEQKIDAAKDSKLRRFVNFMREQSPYKNSISIKMEAVRKGFHLAGLLFILSYFGLFFLPPVAQIVNENVFIFIHQPETEFSYNLLWGDVNEQYPYERMDFQAVIDLTLFALLATLILAVVADLIRVLWGAEYSVFNFFSREILRKKELNAAGPQIYLITGVIFSYLLYIIGFIQIMIVVAGVLIACFSDAAAALIGRKYGKHKITCIGGDIKSWEGFAAGAGSAYIIALIVVGPVGALIAAGIFFILDYFPVAIADNILNPILITIGLGLFFTLTGLSIGWV
ncbi:MAG: hypothetical protein ACTSR8_10775 [Promethearchaeota archaeon]